MSATEPKDNKIAPKGAKLPVHQLNPSYTVRVICCVFFIFITEIFLAHYIYRLIISEIRENYLSKNSFRQNFQNEIRTESFREEVMRIHAYLDIRKEHKISKTEEKTETNTAKRVKRNLARNTEFNFLAPGHTDEPQVEFFNPKLRSLLEEKDEELRKKTGNKGAAPGDDQWIWVTSSSRIPEKALEGYCKKVQEFCPQKPGPKGDRGVPGLPGVVGPPAQKGDTGYPGLIGKTGLPGFPGPKGDPGLAGMPGMPGFPGEKGEPGRPGLDGRIGIPGTPGLDGLSGRNGHDGIPGKDGNPGRDGKDGINGQKGERGLPGPQGPPGHKGLAGPRGRNGRAGIDGKDGNNGICAYKIENKTITELLIPPSIAGARNGPMGPIVVRETENVRLHCSATGFPAPKITWQKLDNTPISRGAWLDNQVSGGTLNITRVSRDHMGKYLCIANNGIAPSANQTFILEVNFPPLITIQNQKVWVANGSTAVLECETEGFPEPVRYWERSDGMLLDRGDKYRIKTPKVSHKYKALMQLNISKVTHYDRQFSYYCICKNELQTTKGELKIYEIDPRESQATRTSLKPMVFGIPAPDKVDLEDLCKPPVNCLCNDTKTDGGTNRTEEKNKEVTCSPPGISLINLISRWEIRQYGDTKYSRVNLTRSTDCVLYAIGKPVYNRYSEFTYGCWMTDAHPDAKPNYIWVTNETSFNNLIEFRNKSSYRKNEYGHAHRLDHPFSGNAHVVFNGSFFYNVKGTRRILKYNLANSSTVSLDLPGEMDKVSKLYSGQYNYVDFCVDENGLWVIFAVPESNNTAVMKIDHVLMVPQYIWNISIEHHKVGEMFIVCGVLYAVDSTVVRSTKIRFALDLYKEVLLDVNLQFSNPFLKTTMLSYSNRTKELYSWDKGNQLTYPVRSHDIGYNYNHTLSDEKQEEADKPVTAKQTGYEIIH